MSVGDEEIKAVFVSGDVDAGSLAFFVIALKIMILLPVSLRGPPPLWRNERYKRVIVEKSATAPKSRLRTKTVH